MITDFDSEKGKLTLENQVFNLTTNQCLCVNYYWEALKEGTKEIKWADMQEKTGIESRHPKDLFKNKDLPWSRIFVKGSRSGGYKLKVLSWM